MKQRMSFQQAATDPNRPLSITPRQWMYSVQAQLQMQQQLVNKTAKRIASQSTVMQQKQVIGFEKIQMGMDEIISGIKILNQGLIQAKRADLSPLQRQVYNRIKQLTQQALIPYTSDIIEQLDRLQE